jgi:uncharacterized membrane protein
MTMGPVQMLVVGFGRDANFTGEISAEFQKLREQDIIRLVDLLLVRKDDEGNVQAIQRSDLSLAEMEDLGARVGALIGFGAAGEEGAAVGALAGAAELADGSVFADEEVWYVADAIPEGTVAAIALLEHRWAIGLRDSIVRAGGMTLADEWIHPADLVAVGLAASEEGL